MKHAREGLEYIAFLIVFFGFIIAICAVPQGSIR